MAAHDDLERRWRAVWKNVGARGDAGVVYRDLVTRYSEPHRAYHTLAHIRHCLDELDSIRPRPENDAVVALAIWFHDAVYDPRSRDENETKSATLARTVLVGAGVNASLCDRVAYFVLATRRLFPETNKDAQCVVDIDLSILGQPPTVFDEYERGIRQEYSWVDPAVFVQKRASFLRSLAARSFIFSTDFFREKYETRAKENIARSIVTLDRRP